MPAPGLHHRVCSEKHLTMSVGQRPTPGASTLRETYVMRMLMFAQIYASILGGEERLVEDLSAAARLRALALYGSHAPVRRTSRSTRGRSPTS